MRKKLMAANWKMYKTPDQAREFFRDFLPLVSGHARDEIAVCAPFICLPGAVESAAGSGIAVAAGWSRWLPAVVGGVVGFVIDVTIL